MNYTAIAAQITRGDVRKVQIRASSLVLLLNGLAAIERKGVWDNYPTDNEWDDIQGWIAGAAYDILTAYECEECDVLEVDEFLHTEAAGDDGQYFGSGGTYSRTLNITGADNFGNVSRTGNFMTPDSGLYYVRAYAATTSCGRVRANIAEMVSAGAVLLGLNANDDGLCIVDGYVECAGDESYYLQQEVSENGYGGKQLDEDDDEVYAIVRWQRLGNVPT